MTDGPFPAERHADLPPRCALIGLGSNTDALRQLARARGALAAEVRVTALSEARASDAVGGGAGRYLNQLARIEWAGARAGLVRLLRRIEADLGRERDDHSAVVIDLDLLALDGEPDAPGLAQCEYWLALLPTLP